MADAVLDYLEPLFAGSAQAGPSRPRRLQLEQVQSARSKLQAAVERNKVNTLHAALAVVDGGPETDA